MSKVVIVGIDDPYGKTPLQPDILNSSGQKVWNMTGLTMTQYVRFISRYNLYKVDEEHNWALGRYRAEAIVGATHSYYVKTYVACLGREVADAFGLIHAKPLYFKSIRKNTSAAYLPHTSGLNRWYNRESNRLQATEFMRQLGLVAIGEIDELPLEDIDAGIGSIAV